MELQTLYYFRDIALGKTFFEVAEDHHTSQSSVSKAIKRLEEELNTDVFERKKNSVALTDAGRCLLNMVQRIDPIIQSALRNIAASGQVREVRICVVPRTDFMNLEIRIDSSTFVQDHPEIKLTLVSEDYLDQSIEMIRRQEIDLMVTPLFQLTRDYCDYVEVSENPMYAVLPRDHPLATCDRIDFTQLYNEHIITRSYIIRRALQECCNSIGLNMMPHFEFLKRQNVQSSRMRILNEVSVGKGITCYFRNDLHPLSMRNLAYIELVNVPRFPVVLAKQKGQELDTIQQQVWDYLYHEISTNQDW